MDPDTTLDRLADAIADRDLVLALDYAADLDEWIRKGGFHPAWIRHPEASRWFVENFTEASEATRTRVAFPTLPQEAHAEEWTDAQHRSFRDVVGGADPLPRVTFDPLFSTVFVHDLHGMVVGIETDGYSHT